MGGGSSKKQTVGYKYYVGMHQALCHGPTDKLVAIRVADKLAWAGASAGGAVAVAAKDLFGGEKREGGIEGTIDVCMGGPAEGQNEYLASKLGGALLPAFRGVMCAVMRQVYIGLNPYLKDWSWMVQRIHTRSGGAAQWNDGQAAINEYPVQYGTQVNTTKAVFVLEPNTIGWAYVQEDEPFTKTAADIPPFGANIAPFVAENSGFGGYLPPHEAEMPDGRRFLPARIGGGLAGYAIVGEGTAEENEENGPYRYHWISISFALVDLSPVYMVLGANDGASFFIDDAPIGDLPIIPTKKSIKLTIRHDFPERLRQYVYWDAAAWQVVPVSATGGSGVFADMNPVHIIRECLTDPSWGLGYSEENDVGDSFWDAADICYNEGLGISLLWSQQTSLEDFIMEILRHIDAALYVDRRTGKFEIKMIREDTFSGDPITLSPANASVEAFTKMTTAELVNEVTVSYDSHETGQVETVTLQNLALIQEQGAIIPATVEYMGFSNQATALKAAQRDLRAMSTPLASATLIANRQAAGLDVGDVFWWSWPEYDEEGTETIIQYLMRVVEISFGDGMENAVRIECVQDVFSLPSFTYVEVEQPEWEDPTAYPLPAFPRVVMEFPYYELVRLLGEASITEKLSGLPDLGFIFVAAGRQGQELNAEINSNTGGFEYADGDMLDFCPYASLTAEAGYLDTTLTLANIVDLDEDFEGMALAQIGSEIVFVESIVGTTATIRRGCLDTVPVKHAATEKLVIWDERAEGDEVEYVLSEMVGVRLRTSTGDGVLNLIEAPLDGVVMKARAISPYPPADVKINATYFPETVELETDLELTWVHRDRLQQTAGDVLGWTDGSVGPEAGTTYSARLVRLDTEEELDSVSAVAGTTTTLVSAYSGPVRLEVWSVRGGRDSYQKVEHMFDHLVVKIVDDIGATANNATTSGNVLTNDSAVGTLAVTEVNALPANVGAIVPGSHGGNFVIAANGAWTFDPDGDFNDLVGTDTRETSVSYTGADATSYDTATLTVTISAP